MDWIAVALLIVFAINIIASIACAKMNVKEENTKNAVLYVLYKELKRYNDNTFGKEE